MISNLVVHITNKLTCKEKRRYTSKDREIIRESEERKQKGRSRKEYILEDEEV